MSSTEAAGSLILPRSHGITVEEEEEDELGCMTTSDSSQSNFSESSSDMDDDATSPTSPPEEGKKLRGPLYGMSALASELPIKRGLSKYYDGKSRTFTSLSNVQCLEDLAKPGRRPPHRRKLKPSKSYGGGLDSSHHRAILCPSESSKAITKKPSGGSLASSLGGGARRHSFISGRPPVHPHRSNHFCSNQTLLFA